MTDPWKSSPVRPRWKHIWIHGFVIGVGCVLIGFVVWFLITGPSISPDSQTGGVAPQGQALQVPAPRVQPPPGASQPATPSVTSTAPVDVASELQSQLALLLNGIKAANQAKDLPQLLSHYSPDFPQLQQRARNISQNWKTYDYLKMDFHLAEVRLLSDTTAIARVTWDVETRNISTRKNKHIVRTYLIRFARESGQWRVKALETAK
jgi:hypothetical protein